MSNPNEHRDPFQELELFRRDFDHAITERNASIELLRSDLKHRKDDARDLSKRVDDGFSAGDKVSNDIIQQYLKLVGTVENMNLRLTAAEAKAAENGANQKRAGIYIATLLVSIIGAGIAFGLSYALKD